MTGTIPAAGFRVARSTTASKIGVIVALPVVGVLVALPYLFPSGIQQSLVQLFILIIMGTMWNLLAGYAGMVSIGQQAYIGIGGYGLVAAANLWRVDPFLAIFVGALVAAVVAIPVSFLIFRLSGGYFAIGTWVVAEVVMQITSRIPGLGGGVGMNLVGMTALAPTRRIAYVYWLGLALVVLAVAVTYLLMRSRLGAGFTAIRDDPIASASLGVPVTRSKRITYVIAAAGCAFAGGLLAISTLQVKPDSMFSVNFASYMIFIVVIGGLGTIEGPILGAIVFFALQQWLSALGAWYLVILGVLAVLLTLLLPRGLWGLAADRGIRLFPVGYRLVLSKGRTTKSLSN